MTTLLTKKTKKSLKRDYLVRFNIVFFGCAVFLMFVWVVLTWALFFVLDSEKEDLNKQIDKSNQLAVSGFLEKYEKSLNEVEDKLMIFESDHVSKGDIIDFVYKIKPEDILFDVISVIEEDGKTFVSLKGVAGSRERLIFFKKLIEEDERVKDFNLPLSSFTKNEAIPFNVTFTYEKK